MNTKIFGELGAAVGVRTLAYSVCSLAPSDRPSSEKTISKSDPRRLTKENFEWPTDADLDVGQLPVLPKNLAKISRTPSSPSAGIVSLWTSPLALVLRYAEVFLPFV
jgi:hypothetical protein